MTTRSISSLHLSKTDKVSDKWESYLDFYDSLFAPLCDSPVSLLEIGVQNGGSLETWAEFFQEGRHIVGCDIDPKCGQIKYDDPRISVIVGDANSNAAHQAIQAIAPQYDIIIDDGSHVSIDILNAFVNYFPLVKPGGYYIVEDTHTLYDDGFGGGILNEFGAYAFFKKLVDVVNFQFWRDQLSINTYLRTFFPLKSLPSFISEGWVDSIEFRNSIITIRKAEGPGHEKLGRRLIVGRSAQVQDWSSQPSPE